VLKLDNINVNGVQQSQNHYYDESKVPPCVLPDPLVIRVPLIGPNSVENVAKIFAGGIFGNQDPQAIHRINPDAKVYRYQLGPYIEIKYVPKELVPSSHPFFANAGTAPLKLVASAIARQGPDGPNPGFCTWPREFPPYVLTVPDDPAWLAYLETFVKDRAGIMTECSWIRWIPCP